MIRIINGSPESIEPVYLSTSEDMRRMDEDTVKKLNISYADLMEKAAESAFDYINNNTSDIGNVTILCGAGNNGGDGYVLARLFGRIKNDKNNKNKKNNKITVTVLNVFGKSPRSETALMQYNKIADSENINFLKCSDLSDEKLQEIFRRSDIIIDAVFGTGFKGGLDGEARRVTKLANNVNEISKIFKISIDVPSGADCDTGRADINSFKADLTLTFEFVKLGLVSYPMAEYAGDIAVLPIGFTKETKNILINNPNKFVLLTGDYIKKLFENQSNQDKRKSGNTNKGDFGRLLAICGSKNMTGAAYLASMGALRTGVGLLYLASDIKAVPVLQSKLNEPVFVPLDYGNNMREENIKILSNIPADSILIGPGLGLENGSEIINILNSLIKLPNSAKTIIFDADGINALCENINVLREVKAEKILTPHPGEMARLCKAAGFGANNPSDVQNDRINIASDFAKKYSCVLVLKGAGTVIADKNGDVYINNTGNPGMSKGGSGDILAGMIASYCAQGVKAVDAACLGVYFHGLAGDIAAERYSQTGMIPSDMLNIIAEVQK
ncbi:MAG: NAD(P)H-hydrate dehydratase [Oscillospiraceae bacterium]|nr:NAD(P)H-hydrate dehydratase [Oscillospiraceae bacterium]